MSKNKFTHLTENGQPQMVDISDKLVTDRTAKACGAVILKPETILMVKEGLSKKGDVLLIAQTAGIMGAKKTSELIPLCHNINLNTVDLELNIDDELPGINICATVKTKSRTGAEMEALTAVSIAALTVYDMLKAVEKTIRINNIRLVEKHGGKSGSIINA